MIANSLLFRTTLSGIIWIAVALVASGWAILAVFQASAVRQFDSQLQAHLELLTGAVASDPDKLEEHMSYPDFMRVYSGLYWQAKRTDDGTVYRSRSLWDGELVFSMAGADVAQITLAGPDNQTLRLLGQRITTPDGGEWILAIASDTGGLEAEYGQFRRTLIIAFTVMGLALIGVAVLMQRSALAPLKRLRRAVLDRHANGSGRIGGSFPVEIQPLITDLNLLLERNERLREKGRAQAANLAHALKTPSAILQNELTRAERGEDMNIALAEEAVDKISAVADRYLSLVSAGPDDRLPSEKSDFVQTASEALRAIGRLFPDKTIELDAPETLLADIDRSDQFELLGNLIENAGKWAETRVVIRLSRTDGIVEIVVEDDGPGVPDEAYGKILAHGVRLDETRGGSGLGLTIVQDVVDRYHGSLTPGVSALGGLRIEVRIPDAASE